MDANNGTLAAQQITYLIYILEALKGLDVSIVNNGLGDASLAEQQSQTTVLNSINTVIDQTVVNKLNDIITSLQSIDLTTLNELPNINNNLADVISTLQNIITNQATDLSEQQAQTSQLVTLNTLDRGAGAITPATLRVVIEEVTKDNILNILGYTMSSNQYIGLDNWDKIPGNSVVFIYTNGIANPSNKLLSIIEYYTGVSIQYQRNFEYDNNDNLTTITSI